MVSLDSDQGERGKPRQQPFAITRIGSDDGFAPELYPERVQVTKERKLDRQQNYCKNEDVTDNGSKNRDIHVSGILTRHQLDNINNIAETGDNYTFVSATWSGEVKIKSIEVEGPTGWWPQKNTMLWQYRIDAVSTGTDEDGKQKSEDGIISEGEILPSDRRLYELAGALDGKEITDDV
jgi:hypothetical protein